MRPVVSNWSASGCYKDFRGVEGVSDGGPEHARVAEPDEAKTSGSAVGRKSAAGGHTGHRTWWRSSPRRLRPIAGSTAITFRRPSTLLRHVDDLDLGECFEPFLTQFGADT